MSFSEFITLPPWSYWHLSGEEVKIWLIGLGFKPQHATLLSENEIDNTLEGLDYYNISEILYSQSFDASVDDDDDATVKKYEVLIAENYESLRYLDDDKWGGNLENSGMLPSIVQQFYVVELELWMDLLDMSETDTGIKLVEFMCGIKPQLLNEEFESLKQHYRDLQSREKLTILRNYTYKFGFPFDHIFDKEKSSESLVRGIRNDSWEIWAIVFKELYRGPQ